MIHNLITPLTAVLLLLTTVPARADGLLYQLPADGAWVQFDSKIVMKRGDLVRDATGQLRMASVGSVTEGGKKCRWIEFKMAVKVEARERVIVAKLLVPEDQLKAGQKPMENRVRGWIRIGEGNDVAELTAEKLGPLPAFLANPLADVKPLEAKIVESPLGKLSCAGLTGRTEFAEGTNTNKATFETRRHEGAPFGVVSCRMKIDIDNAGSVTESLDVTLSIAETGKAAESELPDHK